MNGLREIRMARTTYSKLLTHAFSVSIFLMLLLLGLFIAGPITAPSNASNAMNAKDHSDGSVQVNPHVASSYTSHGSITIRSNADFASQGWPGSGTKADPYIIEGLNITDTDDCISIQDTTAYFVIRNCLLTGGDPGAGITLNNVTNGRIEGCRTLEKYNGIFLESSTQGNIFVNNTIDSSSFSGIELSGSSTNTFVNNTISFSDLFGILLSNSPNNILVNNTFVNNGVYMLGSLSSYVQTITPNNTVNGKTLGYFLNKTGETLDGTQYGQLIVVNSTDMIVQNGMFVNASVGLSLIYSSNSTLINNTVRFNQFTGMEVEYSPNCIIMNNTASNNGYVGIATGSSDNLTIVHNTISSNEMLGFLMSTSSGLLMNNTISNNRYGMDLGSSVDSVLRNNTISHNSFYGVELSYSFNDTIMDNCIVHNGNDGIYLISSPNNMIVNNTISFNGDDGILLATSSNIVVANNTISYNEDDGLHLVSVQNLTLNNNEFVNGGVVIENDPLAYWILNVTTDNTVNGKPLGYFLNKTGGFIDGQQYGQIILVNSTGVTLQNGIFNNASRGIQLAYSNHTTVVNNSASFNADEGIFLYHSANNSLMNNSFCHNFYGAYLHTSSDNVLINNTILYSSNDGVYIFFSFNTTVRDNFIGFSNDNGLYVYNSIYCVMSNNSVSNNHNGIYILSGIFNYVLNNTISFNTKMGVKLLGSDFNTIWNNTFVSNQDTSVYIDGCDTIDIFNNTISSSKFGVFLSNSKHATMNYNELIDNGVGIKGRSLSSWIHNITPNNTVYGKKMGYFLSQTGGTIDGLQYGQMILVNCTGMTIRDGVFSNVSRGITLAYSSHNHLLNNSLFYNREFGIHLYSSANNTLENTTVSFSEEIGINLEYSSNNTLVTNTIYSSNQYGVSLSNSNNNTLANNTISENQYGIYLTESNHNTIANNTISWNSYFGIAISFLCKNNLFYLNTLIWNKIANAWDSGSQNHWNSTNMGNYWSDYSGTGVYHVSGFANSVDYHPMHGGEVDVVPPNIDHPADIIYTVGTTGHNITWHISDKHPAYYQFYLDDMLKQYVSWDNGSLSMNVDGLDVGTHNATLVVYDGAGNHVNDTVYVIVILSDEYTPVVDHPADVVYEEGSTGHGITWSPYDDHPARYEIFRNGTLIDSGTWNNESISISVDGLSAGTYNFTLIVFDLVGNHVSDTVFVTVTPDNIAPSIDHPADIVYVEGTTGRSITWNPSDAHPASYEIYRNGTLVDSGTWNNEAISIAVGGLSVGTYNFTLVVQDVAGNHASDTVLVIVIPSSTTSTATATTTTTPSGNPPLTPGNIMTIVLILIGVGAAVVIIIVVIKTRGR